MTFFHLHILTQARGRGVRRRFKGINWDVLSREERANKARQLSRPPRLEFQRPPPTPNSMVRAQMIERLFEKT
jgi:hypothetical protein